MRSRFTTVIFDLDGTLFDSREGVAGSFLVAARKVFPELVLQSAHIPVGPPIRQMAREVFPGISGEDTEKLAQEFRSHYDSIGCVQTRLFEGALSLLSEAHRKGIALHVATNKPLLPCNILLQRLMIAPFFGGVVTVDSRQPAFTGKAEMIRCLQSEFHFAEEDTLFVGDTGEDALAAQACGIPFVWAAYGYGKTLERDIIPLKVIKKLADLSEIL